jgi:hypothetical protein
LNIEKWYHACRVALALRNAAIRLSLGLRKIGCKADLVDGIESMLLEDTFAQDGVVYF